MTTAKQVLDNNQAVIHDGGSVPDGCQLVPMPNYFLDAPHGDHHAKVLYSAGRVTDMVCVCVDVNKTRRQARKEIGL